MWEIVSTRAILGILKCPTIAFRGFASSKKISVKLKPSRPNMEFCVKVTVSCFVCKFRYIMFFKRLFTVTHSIESNIKALGNRQVIHLVPRG